MTEDPNVIEILCFNCDEYRWINTDLIENVERPLCMDCKQSDDLNPEFLYCLTRSELLIQILEGKVNPIELAKEELKKRRYVRMKSGRWIQQ